MYREQELVAISKPEASMALTFAGNKTLHTLR